MKGKEDFKILTRSMTRRPVETLLLIIGIALGVGATSAGLSLVFQSRAVSAEIIRMPEYREITASTRGDSDTMNQPAQELIEDEVRLTVAELAAADEAPDVVNSYLFSQTRFRTSIPNFGQGGGPEGMPAEEPSRTSAGEEDTPEDSAAAGEKSVDAQRPPQDDRFAQMQAELAALKEEMENEPSPVLEEFYGYKVSPEFFESRELTTVEGSLFTESDMQKAAPYMILGSNLAEELFEDGISINRKVQDFTIIYTVIGILETTGTSLDGLAFVPTDSLSAAATSGGRGGPGGGQNQTLRFSVDDPERLDEAASQLQNWFDRELGTGAVSLSIPREEAEKTADRNNRLTSLILILALSALLIAAVNVSNILLSRALKKRKAIGILKALGSSRSGVFILFLKEAAVIGGLGTAVGIIMALGLSPLMSSSMGFATFSIPGLAAGVLLSMIITFGLTLLPAMQASKIAPAEAVRIE
ncbi:MAG: ABC transporter permease [Spirochaetales bacterium]|nr:ABC transporter permease [Spirochaetales bacterium]